MLICCQSFLELLQIDIQILLNTFYCCDKIKTNWISIKWSDYDSCKDK